AEERKSVAVLVRGAIGRAQSQTPDDPELEDLLARSYVVSPGDDPSPGWPHVERASQMLPARSDVQLDRLALAALTGHDAEAQQMFEAHFRHADRPELARAARHALLVGDVRASNRLIQQGDLDGAIARLTATRERLGDDPEVVKETDRYLTQLRNTQASHK